MEVERTPWAGTPEFAYIYTKMFIGPQRVDGVRTGEFVDIGKELLDLAQAQIVVINTPQATDKKDDAAYASSRSPVDEAAKLIASPDSQKWLAPCLELPSRGTSRMTGIYSKEDETAAIFFDFNAVVTPRADPERELAMEFFERLVRSGLATKERRLFRQQQGWPDLPGNWYVLRPEMAEAVWNSPRKCIPLGNAKIESMDSFGPIERRAIRGWGSIRSPASWTAALTQRFPGVAIALRDGFGIEGFVTLPPYARNDSQSIQVVTKVPQFGVKPIRSPNAFLPFNAERVQLRRSRQLGWTPIDKPGFEGSVRFTEDSPCVTADGLTVSSDLKPGGCGTFRMSRGYKSGKVYAEIEFSSEIADKKPNRLTNAAITYDQESVSIASAPDSFAIRALKRELKGGDLIGIAADFDEGVIYVHVNGEWRTGRPDTGIGESVINWDREYFIAVSAQGGNKGEKESWFVNVGRSPFKYAAPQGYRSYGAAPQ